jgi:hypothetical protein
MDADKGTPIVEAYTDEPLIKCCKLRNVVLESMRKKKKSLNTVHRTKLLGLF